MKSPCDSLQAGMTEAAAISRNDTALCYPYMFGSLAYLAAALVEGSTNEKKFARAVIKKYIADGRRILNAADHAAKAVPVACRNCGHTTHAHTRQDPCMLCGEPLLCAYDAEEAAI